MAAQKSQRNAILQTAIILSVVYVGVPLVLHLFPDDHAQGEVVTSNVEAPQAGNEVSHSKAPLNITNILTGVTLILLAIRHTLEFIVLRIPLLLYVPLKHAYLVLAYIARTIARLLYPAVLPLIYGTQFATAFLLVPIAFLQKCIAFLYPVYVFVGAACTCGAILGLLARFTNSLILSNIFSISTHRPKQVPSHSSREVTSTSRGRLKKEK
ncbi:hypothetical protein SCHPADRAFT_941880 [Schizopora paradoxa]|uniref:Uncharacterized protein n=1 Tax=Schizopora paradoxa TaxID=27342 RepID=A0A0H2RJ51_9AGAM|nr:hypothetical protein SCHPADRAFT_941880 [Schizopora paradoxa]